VTYKYQNVWKKITPELITEITEFWAKENALPKEAQPAKRAEQVVAIMRDKNNELAAVSTAIAKVVPRLRQTLYYYRTFCAEKHRLQNTSTGMLQASQKALLEYNQGKEKPDAIGIIIEIENKKIHDRFNEATWTNTSFSFIGYSPRGLPLRVYYFPGFKLQAPARLEQDKKNAGAVKKQINIDKSTAN
jgi:hypothetical protein